jgi:hypothetical protein
MPLWWYVKIAGTNWVVSFVTQNWWSIGTYLEEFAINVDMSFPLVILVQAVEKLINLIF